MPRVTKQARQAAQHITWATRPLPAAILALAHPPSAQGEATPAAQPARATAPEAPTLPPLPSAWIQDACCRSTSLRAVVAACLLLRQLLPRHVPALFTYAQITALLASPPAVAACARAPAMPLSPTDVRQDVARLMAAGVVRPVAAGETRTDGALVFEADFQAALQASARPPPADTTRGALHGTGHRQNEPDVQDSIRQRFADVLATLPPTTATLSSAQLEHAGLTQDDAQTLVADGFLILVNDGVYGITIRGGGRYWSHLDKGCEEVTRVLRRRVKISGIAEAVSSTIP
ncbi:hypothetical protein CXG81DRAFT_26575 [Caulochytrium protostelioides]|uniref:Winged helix DNA-binding domain-containing protein n=1 Tax=Caulochytrium protostelioides TaxID=1555241 RepID=A0A4V1IUJ2_9FUNG|nr:hypothetical protein CXG81DRAFT_26575 [Caulochytrium protostelioides]|eukprot:RKP00749.1 hypothetical protein CXG81DRAFT_26575 [Caulochytrium protostelioides]